MTALHVGRDVSRAVLRAFAGLLLAWACGVQASHHAPEAGVKAAYVYNFLSFVEWPASAFADAVSPVAIGVAGDDQVLAELQRMLPGRSVHGRSLQVRKLQPGDATGALHVLFVGTALAHHPWLATLRERLLLLLITDAPGGLEDGAAINFLRVDGRVRFEVSLPAVERSGLRLSSRMLGVAERVVGAR